MIRNLDDAVRYFIKQKERDSYRILTLSVPISGTKGVIMRIVNLKDKDGNIKKYFVSYKRDWLHSFKYLFNKPQEGFGQTFNMRALKIASQDLNSILVVVMDENKTYYCPAFKALEYIQTNNTIRTPSTEIGEEGSIPARMLSSSEPI